MIQETSWSGGKLTRAWCINIRYAFGYVRSRGGFLDIRNQVAQFQYYFSVRVVPIEVVSFGGIQSLSMLQECNTADCSII